MKRAPYLAFVVAVALAVTTACGSEPNLATALEVTDVLTGYYDSGLKDGSSHLVPSISFRLHNKDTREVGAVALTVSFWKQGDDGEWESVVVQGIHGGGLAGGGSTESILARTRVGFNLQGARADFFAHHLFLDVTAKLFASRGGAIVPIGQFKLDRRIIPRL